MRSLTPAASSEALAAVGAVGAARLADVPQQREVLGLVERGA